MDNQIVLTANDTNPFESVSRQVLSMMNGNSKASFCLKERTTTTVVNLAIDQDKFIGEHICNNSKIDWMQKWMPVTALPAALFLWNIPVCSDVNKWTVTKNPCFYRILKDSNEFVSRKDKAAKELPDKKTDPRFLEYSGKDHVYFIQAKNLGLIKVGFSSNVSKRLAALKTSSPDELEIIKIVSGGADLERWFHKQFAECRVHGEWFKPNAEMMQIIGSA